MAKNVALGLVMMFLVLVTAPMILSEEDQGRILNSSAKKITMYFQLISGGPNVNLVSVAGRPNRTGTLTEFGNVFVGDVPGTEGVSINSPEIARVQGLIVVSSLDATKIFYSYSIVFISGQYKGSTLELQGAGNSGPSGLSGELSINSGSKSFELVKGYGLFQTVLQNPATSTTVIRSDIYIKY